MLLLDKIVNIGASLTDEDFCIAEYRVAEDCLFLKENGRLEPVALMEIMAQSFAAGNGVTHPARFGYLASMRSMKIHGDACVGDVLRARVRLVTMMQSIMVVEGRLWKEDAEHGEVCLLEGQYKIFVPDASAPDTQDACASDTQDACASDTQDACASGASEV